MSQTKIVRSGRKPRNNILISTPSLGVVRLEWAMARWGQVIPCNWSCGYVQTLLAMGYLVADAQNVAVKELVERNYEWLFLLEDDVMLQPDCFLKLDRYVKKGDIPVVSGLYYTKSEPSDPLVFRGRGNGCFTDFKRGKKVWCDGVPTGCLLIHGSILRKMWEDSEEYHLFGKDLRRVFETPRKVRFDPETKQYGKEIGTSDLYWCDRVMDGGYLKKAGWSKFAKKKDPFLVDTSIFCQHIDLNTGKQYPREG